MYAHTHTENKHTSNLHSLKHTHTHKRMQARMHTHTENKHTSNLLFLTHTHTHSHTTQTPQYLSFPETPTHTPTHTHTHYPNKGNWIALPLPSASLVHLCWYAIVKGLNPPAIHPAIPPSIV